MNAAPQKYLAKSPYCDHILDPETAIDGWVTCACGHKSDVRWVSELGWLQTRKDWVAERVTKSEPWFDSRHQAGAKPQRERTAASGQQLLYILGGVSLVVAVAVFTAVAWERIGAYGQLAALMAVVAISSFVAIKSRERLVGLSNTSAVLATIVAGTGFLSAPFFGLVDKTWSDPNSFYTSAVLLLLIAASYSAGYLTRIPGWTLIATIGLAPTTLLVSENYLNSSQSRPNYLSESMAVFSVAIIAAALMMYYASRRHYLNSLYKISITGIELFLVFLMFTKLMDSIEPSSNPLLIGGTYLVLAVVWAFAGYRIPQDENGFSTNAVSKIANYVASVLFGFAIPIAIIPKSAGSTEYFKYQPLAGSGDMTIMVGVIFGSALMILPMVGVMRKLQLQRYLTVAGAVAWYATTEISNRVVFEEGISDSVTLFSLTLISLSLSIRWWNETTKPFYITAVVFGSIAVGYGVATFVTPHFDGPEAVTLSVAVYLWLMARVLSSRTSEIHNSFIVLGIPLIVALIPSAMYANSMLYSQSPTASEWLRFWAVTGVSVILLVLGLRLQKSGLFIPSAIAFAIVALPQIFLRLGAFVPRWTIFGVIGILLITIAARFEHLQKLGRDTSRWFRSLN